MCNGQPLPCWNVHQMFGMHYILLSIRCGTCWLGGRPQPAYLLFRWICTTFGEFVSSQTGSAMLAFAPLLWHNTSHDTESTGAIT